MYHARPFVGVSQKSIFKRPCPFLAINAHKKAPRTIQWLQERPWNAPTKGLPCTIQDRGSVVVGGEALARVVHFLLDKWTAPSRQLPGSSPPSQATPENGGKCCFINSQTRPLHSQTRPLNLPEGWNRKDTSRPASNPKPKVARHLLEDTGTPARTASTRRFS